MTRALSGVPAVGFQDVERIEDATVFLKRQAAWRALVFSVENCHVEVRWLQVVFQPGDG